MVVGVGDDSASVLMNISFDMDSGNRAATKGAGKFKGEFLTDIEIPPLVTLWWLIVDVVDAGVGA